MQNKKIELKANGLGYFSFEKVSDSESPYLYIVTVSSKDFSGKSSFYLDSEKLLLLVSSLREMLGPGSTKEVKITKSEGESDSNFKITKLDELGHYTLDAQIGDSWDTEFAKISFDFDQTSLHPFLNSLEKMSEDAEI